MGQSKFNPTAIAAKNGELPPKPPRPSKREQERFIQGMVLEKTGFGPILSKLGVKSFY